jgi:hypothetical protein
MTKKTERATFSRTLTKMLEDAGMEDVSFAGTVQPREERLAQLVWSYVINGEVRLKNGQLLAATSREWITALKWLYTQIDGTTKAPRDSEAGGVMTMEWVDPLGDDEEIGIGADEV